MKKRMGSVLSSLLCCCLLFSVLSLNASAEEGTITTIDMDYTGIVVNSDSESDGEDISDQVSVYTFSTYGEKYGMTCYEFPYTDDSATRLVCMLDVANDFSFNSNHEYNLQFTYAGYIALPMMVSCYLNFYDTSGELLKQQIIFTNNHEKNDAPKKYAIDIDFKPDVSDLESGYKCKFCILFYQNGFNSTTISQRFFLSPEIELTDKDDDSSWFQKIINKINDVWESVKSLPDKIGAYIQNIATDIGEGLKELFIPSDDYFDTLSANMQLWGEEHFGFLWTLSDLLSSVIDRLHELLQDGYVFILPAAEFDLLGEHYVLWEEYEVPVAEYIEEVPALQYAYNTYLVVISGICGVALFNYAKKTFEKVTSN